jgi:hypothetical protein
MTPVRERSFPDGILGVRPQGGPDGPGKPRLLNHSR